MSINIEKNAFTLAEVMIAIVIVSALALLALPKVVSSIENMRAREGEQFLYAILGAQKRFSIDNDNRDATPDYADDLSQLDINVSLTLQNFNTPTDTDINTANPVAKITRTGGLYTLYISDNGAVTCNCGGGACATCATLGYATQ